MRIGENTISPDGKTVAVADGSGGRANLYLLDVESQNRKQLTAFEDQTVRQIAWHPDGQSLFFTADTNGDEYTQIFHINADGTDQKQLTDRPEVRHFLGASLLSPCGTWLAFTADITERISSQVWIHNLATGEERELTQLPSITSTTTRWLDPEALYVSNSLGNTATKPYRISLDGEATALADTPGSICVPVAVTESGKIVVQSNHERQFLGLATLTDDQQLDWFFTPDWDVQSAGASHDGSEIIACVNAGGYTEVHVFDAHTLATKAKPEIPHGVLSGLSASHDGSIFVATVTTPTSPANLHLVEREHKTCTQLTDNKPRVATLDSLIDAELVEITSHDGLKVPAFVYRPEGDGPHPVIVSIHGGPQAQETPRYAALYQYLLSKGFGIVAPNVRGSTGYGKDYVKAIECRWGDVELGDFKAVRDFAADLPWSDSSRIGVFGGSYGGFAVLTCLSRQPDLWNCGVDIVGPSNLVNLYNTSPPSWREAMNVMLGNPETDFDRMMQASPITHAENIVAPLFVIQGKHDPRVVQAESDEIVGKLRALGREVRYDIYEDEGHGFSKEENEWKAFSDSVDFFCEHLGS